MIQEIFLELIKNSEIADKDNFIFLTDKKYKNIIEKEIIKAEKEDKMIIFDEDYGIRQENNKIKFQLKPHKLKNNLDLIFSISEKDFLKKNGIKELNKNVFIFEKKAFLDTKCYNFFLKLKNILSKIEVSYEKIERNIVIFYTEAIHIKEEIESLNCGNIDNKIYLLEKLEKDLQIDFQTKSEFLKKAIYENL
jgi:hypothetical protein